MMQCERCRSGAEAIFRVRTDILDMSVCAACAKEARVIGIPVEAAVTENDAVPRGIREHRGKIRVLSRVAPC
jgi:hypothetical protein